MSDDNVYFFNNSDNNKKKPKSNQEKDNDTLGDLNEFIDLIKGKETTEVPEGDDANKKSDNAVTITGNGNILGNNNTINVHHTPKPTPKPKVVVKTGDGVLTATQKATVHKLVHEWVGISNDVKKIPLTIQGAWSRLNGHIGVNSYHEIPLTKYDKAIKYLRVRLGELRGMASAPKKMSSWRNSRVKSIQARCNELSLQGWRKTYMQTTFGKSSMTELDDKELEKLYRAVWAKK